MIPSEREPASADAGGDHEPPSRPWDAVAALMVLAVVLGAWSLGLSRYADELGGILDAHNLADVIFVVAAICFGAAVGLALPRRRR